MNRSGNIVTVFAWAVFICCLFLPAIQFQNGEVIPGWKAGLVAISGIPVMQESLEDLVIGIAGLGNIFMALSPLTLLLQSRKLFTALTVISFLLFVISASFYKPGMGYSPGYFLWVFAYFVMTIGFILKRAGNPHHSHQSNVPLPRT